MLKKLNVNPIFFFLSLQSLCFRNWHITTLYKFECINYMNVDRFGVYILFDNIPVKKCCI